MSNRRICPKCDQPKPGNAPAGLCPKCLLGAGMATDPVGYGFAPPDPTELAIHFPELEIGELLGKGGMGAVYLAQQKGLDRAVAIKILPPEISRDPTLAGRFDREARTLARLNHPNIVQVFDVGQADEYFYFVMEYVDGLNLRQLIEGKNLEPSEALAIIPDICAALQFAHDAGVVHRDIKPENILIDRHGRVKIADFGLAMLLDSKSDEKTLTFANQVMGTPHYMAPEQMRGSRTIDHRADIFSLGVVLYELLTGELPWGHFEPPSRKVRIDVRLDQVVLRSLESTPERRYQHASEVKSQIESIVGDPNAQLPPPKPAVDPDSEEVGARVRRQLKIPAICLLVVGIVNLVVALEIPIVFQALGWGFNKGLESVLDLGTIIGSVAAICCLVSGITMLLGAIRMLDMQSHRVALTAAYVSILPVAVGFPLSLPFGIWALTLLLRRDVRLAFAGETA